MGLDIKAYKMLKLDNNANMDDDNVIQVWSYKHFPDYEKPFENKGIYVTEQPVFRFRAASYSGYNEWRAQLCLMVHGCQPRILWDNPEYKGKAFYELIDFSDCEGIIGTPICEKLASDFAKYEEQVMGMELHFLRLYKDFKVAFEIGKEGGLVKFC